MNELTWLEKLYKEHILYVYYITENVCFSSIDYMSSVIKKHNPNQHLKLNYRYIDKDLINARVVEVYVIDDEYTFIVMF